MGFYDLPKEKRQRLVEKIEQEILADLQKSTSPNLLTYFSDNDTYIRKTAYLATGKIYFEYKELQKNILSVLERLFDDSDEKVRQTVVNAFGEIGKKDADQPLNLYEKAIIDTHHSVRNAVIGSLKKMGEKNPQPVLEFSKKFLHHPNPQVRRQALHGVELRGRTHPEEVLPLLKELQNENVGLVRNMVIHVLGQISYKKGCLEKVIAELKTWDNKEIVKEAIDEILETHKSYEKFSEKSYRQASEYIKKNIY
jgi:HEAT repeat protein